jgi:hypothetical protein
MNPKQFAKMFTVLLDHVKNGKTCSLVELSHEMRHVCPNALTVGIGLNSVYHNHTPEAELTMAMAMLHMSRADLRALTLVCCEPKALQPSWVRNESPNVNSMIMKDLGNKLAMIRLVFAPKPVRPEPKVAAPVTPLSEGHQLKPPADQLVFIPTAIDNAKPQGDAKSLGDMVREGLARTNAARPEPAYCAEAGQLTISEINSAFADVLLDNVETPQGDCIGTNVNNTAIKIGRLTLTPKDFGPTADRTDPPVRQMPDRSQGESEVNSKQTMSIKDIALMESYNRAVEADAVGMAESGKFQAYMRNLAKILTGLMLDNSDITFDELCDRLGASKSELNCMLKAICVATVNGNSGEQRLFSLLIYITSPKGELPYWYSQFTGDKHTANEIQLLKLRAQEDMFGTLGDLGARAATLKHQQVQDEAVHLDVLLDSARAVIQHFLVTSQAPAYAIKQLKEQKGDWTQDYQYCSLGKLNEKRFAVERKTLNLEGYATATDQFWGQYGYTDVTQLTIARQANTDARVYYRTFPEPHVISVM